MNQFSAPISKTPPIVAPVPVAQPSVALHIQGKGLLLSGTFKGWQSRLVLGPDLDDVGLNLFVDVTSVGDDDADTLFHFRSKSVENAGKGRFRVIGDFTGAEPTRELALDVETPLGHTALIGLSFAARKQDFGTSWDSVVQNATLFGDERSAADGPHREAAAWLKSPFLASA